MGISKKDIIADYQDAVRDGYQDFLMELELVNNKILFAARLLEEKPQLLPRQTPAIETEQYSRGGETLHRGYYCPSMVYDIIIGGANRGKLLKRFKKPPTYSYGFDGNGNLVAAKNNDTKAEEVITRHGETEVGITFEGLAENGVSCISLAEYRSGKIYSYVCCNCDIYAQTVSSVYGEVYEYRHGVLHRVFYCMSGGRVRSYSKETAPDWERDFDRFLVEFEHDTEGYLKSYRYIDPQAYAGQTFPVLLKRRV